MNRNSLPRNYDLLIPDERFRLILAAVRSGDSQERDRLVQTSRWITMSLQDHSPYIRALVGLSQWTFIEILEDAAAYLEASHYAEEISGIQVETEEGGQDQEEERENEQNKDSPSRELSETDPNIPTQKRTPWERSCDLVGARAFFLKTWVNGWNLFCQRLSISPFTFWEDFSGFDRLQRTLKLAELDSYGPEEFLEWFNRLPNQPHLSDDQFPDTPQSIADALDHSFNQLVQWWGG